MLVSPGDNVLVESPTYAGALAAVSTSAVDSLSAVQFSAHFSWIQNGCDDL